jgi:dTDP-4-amino-4,6-dideoxygalactose transaminase
VLFKNLGRSFLHIPQTNPRAGYLAQQPEIDAAVSRVLAGGGYILGREVEIFESAFADFISVAHAVACASGTDAIGLPCALAVSALAISCLLCRTLQ